MTRWRRAAAGAGRRPGRLDREHAALDEIAVVAQLLERGELARRRDVIRGPEHHADSLVAEGAEVRERLLHGAAVVDRDAREPEVGVRRVISTTGSPRSRRRT